MTNDSIDFERILCETFVRSYQHFAELNSTNTLALADMRPGDDLPHLILADRQTAGRGRGANTWWSSSGSLTFTLIVDPAHWGIASTSLPLLPLSVGLSVANVLETYLMDQDQGCAQAEFTLARNVRLKWPNDVYWDDRKWGGILIESLTHHPERLAIGIGLNLNNSLSGAPEDIRRRAVSLIDVLGIESSRTDLLLEVLRELSRQLAVLAASGGQLLKEYRVRCWLTGKHVQVATPQSVDSGLCVGVDDAGALCLRTASGDRRLFAGTVSIVADRLTG